MPKNNLLKNTLKLSFGIFINKPIGFLRDVLQMRYFGLTSLGDAYVIAWRIPNVLRRIFSEGLMTNVLLPYLVKLKAEETEQILNEVITGISILMQILVTLFCFLVAFNSRRIVFLLSPGAIDRVFFGAEMLQILIFFTFFTSLSSVLGVTVQLNKKFYVGPLSQFFLNIFFCIELFFSIKYNFSYKLLCLMITLNSFVIIFVHLIAFYKNNFYFILPTKKSLKMSFIFLKKFFIAFGSSFLLEINMFAGLSFSSYLTPGLLSLFEYINALIRLPLQICGSAVATTSQVDIGELVYAKRYELLEKKVYRIFVFFLFISLVITTAIFLFGKRFFILFFSLVGINNQYVLLSFQLFSLFSFLIFPALANKILLNIFYSFHSVFLPTIINFFLSVLSNFFLLIYVKEYGLYCIIFSAVFFEFVRFFIFSVILYLNYGILIMRKERRKPIKELVILFSLFFILFFLFSFLMTFMTKNICFLFKYEIVNLVSFILSLFLYYSFFKKRTLACLKELKN